MPANAPPCRLTQRMKTGASHHNPAAGLRPASTLTSQANVIANSPIESTSGRTWNCGAPASSAIATSNKARRAADRPAIKRPIARIDAGQRGGREQQQAVPAGPTINGRHAALGQPLIRYPRLTGAGETERVLADHPAGVQHSFAAGNVPERARVAEHRLAAEEEQRNRRTKNDDNEGSRNDVFGCFGH